ncbi:MAG: pyridoxal phosphate-dependent aminotransferase [Flavobacteriales bacterium]|nr:MAG: pyridoxal phosphate-dependent aminotransferase [Flavobacteriales bacterium]
MSNKILISPPHISGAEKKYVLDALSGDWISSKGKYIDSFEKKLQFHINQNKEVVCLNSGTSAIHLALKQLGVQENDEVICQSFTFAATAFPVLYQKAIPVFVDSEPDTWNICPVLLEKAIKNRIKNGKKPKAILAVHLYGMPYKIDEVQRIATTYNIPVIEDAAEALGSSYNNVPCGNFGQLAVLSFNGNKIITSAQGGAIVCNTVKEKESFIHWATQAKDNLPFYHHSSVGFNYRMSNVLAAIGLAQIENLHKKINLRRQVYFRYFSELDKDLFDFQKESENSFSNRWMTCILTISRAEKEKLLKTLINNGIEALHLWYPLHKQPVFKEFPSFINGTSEHLFNRGLCLPSGSKLTANEYQKIVAVLKNYKP